MRSGSVTRFQGLTGRWRRQQVALQVALNDWFSSETHSPA